MQVLQFWMHHAAWLIPLLILLLLIPEIIAAV